MKTIHFQAMTSPVGEVFIAADEDKLLAIAFESNWPSVQAGLGEVVNSTNPVIENCVQQLSEYFAGKRQQFDLPTSSDGTDFQKQSWDALTKIPYGTTRTYAEQASTIGKPKAVRAVGSANGRNPISIVIPCHRVIGKSGSLAGYGGGLAAKKYLLSLEGVEI